MKKVLGSLTVLFAAALLIYSCNPIDEDELPPSNTSQMTTAQARQMLQGSWYFHKSQSVNGPICAGGPNETRTVQTYDLQYSGFRIEFTEIAGVIDPIWEIGTFNMYYGGGNGTEGYNIITSSDDNYLATYMDLQEGELYLWFELIFLEGYGIEGGGKIVSLTDEDLVLFNPSYQVLYYFKRSNQTAAPYNAFGLHGNYSLDSYKDVSSGVTVTEESIQNSVVYNFTDEIYYDQNARRVKYTGYRIGTIWNDNELELDYYDSDDKFSFEVSDTHVFSEGANAIWKSYKVHLLNSTELVLRWYLNCNTYKEYHLTKVN